MENRQAAEREEVTRNRLRMNPEQTQIFPFRGHHLRLTDDLLERAMEIERLEALESLKRVEMMKERQKFKGFKKIINGCIFIIQTLFVFRIIWKHCFPAQIIY